MKNRQKLMVDNEVGRKSSCSTWKDKYVDREKPVQMHKTSYHKNNWKKYF